MPKYRECSVDEYLAKRKPVTRDGIVYRAAGAPKTFNAEERSQVFVMTDESVDSYGDVVKASGADLYRFEKNPIALLNHKSDMILGTWSEVQKKPQRIEGKVTLAKEGTAPHVDMAYNLMGQGILRGASIGFMPTKLEMRLDDDGDPMWCYLIHEWELYECSVVSIPANPSALARSIGDHDDLIIARDYVEQVLDGWARSPEGILMPRAEFEKAYTVIVEKIVEDATAPAAPTPMPAPNEVKGSDIDLRSMDDDLERSDEQGAPELTDEVLNAFVALAANDKVDVEFGDEVRIVAKAQDGAEVSHLVMPGTFTVQQIKDVHADVLARIAKVATAPENKPGTVIDAADLAAEIEKAHKPLFAGLMDGIKALFSERAPASADRIEPVIVEPAQVKAPDPEAARKALEHATLLRARLATNGRLAA